MKGENVPDDIRGIEDLDQHSKLFIASSTEMDADEEIADMLRATSMMAKMIIDRLEKDAKRLTPGDYLIDSKGFFMVISTNTDIAFRMMKMADEKWLFEVSQGTVDNNGECTCSDCDTDNA